LKAVPSTVERYFHLPGAGTKILTVDSKWLTVFFRDQGIYLFIAFVVGATFWAIGQPINLFTVILYSLCIAISFRLRCNGCTPCTKNPLPMTG
jgi:hypothetical protein